MKVYCITSPKGYESSDSHCAYFPSLAEARRAAVELREGRHAYDLSICMLVSMSMKRLVLTLLNRAGFVDREEAVEYFEPCCDGEVDPSGYGHVMGTHDESCTAEKRREAKVKKGARRFSWQSA